MIMKSHSVVFVSTLFLLFSCNFFNSDDTGTLVLKVSLTSSADHCPKERIITRTDTG